MRVEFEAEAAAHHGHVAAVSEAGGSAGDAVGGLGDVAPHRGGWVDEGCSELDLESVGGVGVVGCPVLGPVVEKACDIVSIVQWGRACRSYQDRIYRLRKRNLPIIHQGTWLSGCQSLGRDRVCTGTNPMGEQVHAFLKLSVIGNARSIQHSPRLLSHFT